MKKAKRMKNEHENNKRETIKKTIGRNNRKFIILILIFIIIGLIFVVMNYNIFNFNNSKSSNNLISENIVEDLINETLEEKRITKNREYKDLLIDDIKVSEEYGNILFKAVIKNKGEKIFEKKNITIAFVNKERDSIVEYRKHIQEINPGEILEIQLIGDKRIAEAYDFRIIEE